MKKKMTGYTRDGKVVATIKALSEVSGVNVKALRTRFSTMTEKAGYSCASEAIEHLFRPVRPKRQVAPAEIVQGDYVYKRVRRVRG